MDNCNLGRGKGTGNRLAYSLKCEWCGIIYRAKRPDGSTCSNAHRMRWTRWARKFLARFGVRPGRGPRGDAALEAVVRP